MQVFFSFSLKLFSKTFSKAIPDFVEICYTLYVAALIPATEGR
jgi:hypothetical protein